MLCLIFICGAIEVRGQGSASGEPLVITVVDEDGLTVADAQISIEKTDDSLLRLTTDYAGRCTVSLPSISSYRLRVEKLGFYQARLDPLNLRQKNIRITLVHEQMVREEVNVEASSPGIDLQQVSNKTTMATSEIVNIPYPTSRDIRNLLPFIPGVVPDASGQVHLAGSDTYATLDLFDGFDIRSPVSGMLAMRVSPDAIRTIDIQTTRYPAEYGKSTGGIVAFYSGMGDNKFRLNATNFVPSFHDADGIRFDKFVPRVSFSGPLVKDRAWFFDGLEMEYDSIYIKELPANANTNNLIRGSNLIRFQVNVTPSNVLSGGLLVNSYHSPYDGLSSLNPQESTTKRNTTAWLPYIRNQHSFGNGALLESGVGVTRFRDGYEPQGSSPFRITPETTRGGYFENLTGRSQRIQTMTSLYLPPRYLAGRHDLKFGVEIDRLSFSQNASRSSINYLRENGTLLRRSTFSPSVPIEGRHMAEVGAYVQDRWAMERGLLAESGVRFDWDGVIQRPLFSPRLAFTYSPQGMKAFTKISAGAGLYYEHTQLEYLQRPLVGFRYDTYYAADGVTPIRGPLPTIFTANKDLLREMRAINWSIGLEQRLPGSVWANVNFLQKRIENGFTYQNQMGPGALYGNYLLTNAREDRYNSIEFDARRSFSHGYNLFVSYTHSSAHTNATLDYSPTLSILGTQQSGPASWDTPDRVISWGWLPIPLPKLKNSWDFVYTFDRHSGFPYTAINANQQVIGKPGAQRFPAYVSFSPGLEWRFHLLGSYFGLRGVMENATGSRNPSVVNNVIDSPSYGTFSEFGGRSLTARIRLISTK